MNYKCTDNSIENILESNDMTAIGEINYLVRLRYYINRLIETFDPSTCLLPTHLEKIVNITKEIDINEKKDIFFFGGFNYFLVEHYNNANFESPYDKFFQLIIFMLDYFAKDDYVSEHLYENGIIDVSMEYLGSVSKLSGCYDLILSLISRMIPYAIQENPNCLSEFPFEHLLLSKIGAMKLLVVIARHNHVDEYAYQILDKLMSSTNWQIEYSHLAMWVVCYCANNCSVEIESAIILGFNEKPPIFGPLFNQVRKINKQMIVPFLQTCILFFKSTNVEVRSKLSEFVDPDFFLMLFSQVNEPKEKILAFRSYVDSLIIFNQAQSYFTDPDTVDFICDIIMNEVPRLKTLALRFFIKISELMEPAILMHVYERGVLPVVSDMLTETGLNVCDANDIFYLTKLIFDIWETDDEKYNYLEELREEDFFDNGEICLDFLKQSFDETMKIGQLSKEEANRLSAKIYTMEEILRNYQEYLEQKQ